MFCNNFLIQNVHVIIKSKGSNTDGITIDSCQNVSIINNFIQSGDDNIVLKSGKNLNGRLIGLPTKNVIVKNNIIGKGSGITIGSEVSGNIENVLFENIILNNTKRGARIKTCYGRGGYINNIVYKNIKFYNLRQAISILTQFKTSINGENDEYDCYDASQMKQNNNSNNNSLQYLEYLTKIHNIY